MDAIPNNSVLRHLLRAPIYLYRWHLGQLLGRRFLLLSHTGRRTGARHQTVLEVMEYRKEGPEAVVMSGFGQDSDWLQNIEKNPNEEIEIGGNHSSTVYLLLLSLCVAPFPISGPLSHNASSFRCSALSIK